MTTKILALTDALGNLVRFTLLPGQRFDTVGVPPLLDGMVIPPLLVGFVRRLHAAIFNLCAGVTPPMPMFGRSLL